MKIINSHVHMIEVEKALKMGSMTDIPQDQTIFKDIDKTLALMDMSVLQAQMAEAGIEKSVLYAVEAPFVYASNEYVSSLCSQYPDKFIGFASVDPKRPDAAAVIETALTQQGLKGIKLHPPLQNFYPNDRIADPIYEKAIQHNVPVVFHVGSTPFGCCARLDQAHPILLDEVACRFPKLKIVLTHLGTLWHNEAFMLVEKNPNVYIDTAAYLYEITELLTPNTVERIGPHKIIFGTDYPTPFGGRLHNMKDFVDCVKALKLSDEIKEMIFCRNLERVLTYKA